MIIQSKAPLRISFGGGGTDIDFYAEKYGGAVINATINQYAYATIEERSDGAIVIQDFINGERVEFPSCTHFEIDGIQSIAKGVYNAIIERYHHAPLSFTLSISVDVPMGSGLGTSSTLVVAIVGAFVEWLRIPLGEYEIASLAYEIERKDLGMAGGKQDQYAATFGGFNFMEFYKDNRVIINPLRIREEYSNKLSFNLILYYTGISRYSSEIIEKQSRSVVAGAVAPIEAMHGVKEQARLMKDTILTGQMDSFGELLEFGWEQKKQMAEGISSTRIDEIYEVAKKAGATGGKMPGAGGGGFMLFYCPGVTRYAVQKALSQYGGTVTTFQFTQLGLETWV